MLEGTACVRDALAEEDQIEQHERETRGVEDSG